MKLAFVPTCVVVQPAIQALGSVSKISRAYFSKPGLVSPVSKAFACATRVTRHSKKPLVLLLVLPI
jgi:hypothetical protein